MATENPDPELWAKWLRGTRAFDTLWGAGERCPANGKRGARCLCAAPSAGICKIWVRLAEIAEGIGGTTAEMVRGMD